MIFDRRHPDLSDPVLALLTGLALADYGTTEDQTERALEFVRREFV